MAYEDLYGSPVSTTDDWANNPWINNMATRGVMSGLQWLGETLGKPQRALFGTLAGDPTALANLIPFSDTLGITDPSKAVTGRDLLRKAGVVDQQDNWGNFAGGLALDIAADPLAWVRGPLGALTKTGEAAAKAGTLERSLAKRIRGTPGMASAAVEDATLGSNLLSHQMPVSDALVPRAEGAIGSVIPQMASGVAESSLGQSGKLMPQGGWFSITDRPWYVEPFMGKADNVYIGGTGKIGQGAADLVDKGWDKATRARIPGTDFSPVAWLRSAFEPGAANVTAHPELTTHLGESVVPETNAYKAASGNLASPMYGSHSETINELMKLGMAHEDAAKAMSWAGRSTRELGEMRLPSGVQLPDNAAQVLERYGNDYAKRIETLTDTVRDPYLKVGGELPEAKSMWGHPYAPRTMADTGIKRTQQQMERSDLLSKLPGGAVMAEAFTTDPVISGILNRKTAGASAGTRDLGPSIHQWGGKPITVDQAEALIKKRGIDYADAIEAEAQKQLAKNYLPVQAVPEEALKLASKGGAAELGQEMARYVAGLPKEVAERGYFYNLDLATGARNYGTNIAPQTAVRSGVLNAMAKEAKDYVKLADKTDDLTKIMSLDKVLEHAGMKSGADELAKRMGLEKTSDLSKYGLDKKFADAIKKEIEGPSAAKPSVLRTLTDAFRYGVTVPWPANFVRNYTGEITNQGIAGTGAAKNLGGAVKFLSGQLAEGTPEYAKFQQAYQHGVAHGLLESGQTRQLTGTGVTHSGNLLINTMPPQRAANAAEVLQNWAKPMVSETAREDLGITPFRELMGFPKNAPAQTVKANPYAAGVATDVPRIVREQTALATTSQRQHASQGGWSASESKASAAATSRGPVETLVDYAGKVIDPARGYLGAMEVAHEFQNNATRLQQFVNLIDEGYTPASAAQRVKVLQRDYEATTPFMQNNVKNMVPFANFCMPLDHEILTRDGWKTQDQLVVGEDVMAYDVDTESLVWQPLQAINVFDYQGELMCLRKKGDFEFSFTPEHMWPTKTPAMTVKRPYATYHYEEKRGLTKGCDLRGYHSIPTAGNFVGNSDSILTPRQAAILGWVVTDGYSRWKRGYCEMVVYQSPKKFLKEIQELLGTKSRKPHPETGVVCTPVALADSKEIAKHFKTKKDLSWIVGRLSRESAEAMWDAMFKAEGSVNFRNGRQQFSQLEDIGRDVLDAFQILCLMTEKNMAIRTKPIKKTNSFGGRVKGRGVCSTHYIKTTKWSCVSGNKGPVPTMTRRWHSGKVWCPTTPWRTWLVRHNGHVLITGNSAQNLKTQADLLSSNTGRYAAMAKLLNSGRSGGSFVPGYASSGAAIEIPGAPDGKQRYLGSLGLTVEDEAISALASLLSGRGEEAVRKVATSSNPALKSMYEIATGRQVFSGRNLDDLAPSPIFSSILGDNKTARMASELTSGTPLARAMSTVDRLAASPEKGVMSTLLNLGTGIRTVDVDKQQAAQIAARDTIQKLLNSSDQYKTRESIVIDPKWRGREDEIPPEIQALMKEYLYLQKRAADAVKAKRASGN